MNPEKFIGLGPVSVVLALAAACWGINSAIGQTNSPEPKISGTSLTNLLLQISQPPPPAPLPYKLSPEAQRLQKSPYFRTWFNEFDQRMINLVFLETGMVDQLPEVQLIVSRSVDSKLELFFISTDVYSSNKWETGIYLNKPLELIIDGNLYTCGQCDVDHSQEFRSGKHSESAMFYAGEVVVRALARASRAQVRVHTYSGDLVRDVGT